MMLRLMSPESFSQRLIFKHLTILIHNMFKIEACELK